MGLLDSACVLGLLLTKSGGYREGRQIVYGLLLVVLVVVAVVVVVVVVVVLLLLLVVVVVF